MITELRVSNFRSLGRDVCLRPGALSFLFGPNGSGKSNILDALSFVRDAVTQGLPAAITHRGGIDAVRRRSSGHPYNVRIELVLALKSGPARYGFEIAGDRVEEYRVKAEWAVGAETSSTFEREGETWSGPPGLSLRIDEQSLALTVLAGDARFSELCDLLSHLVVYSVFPDTLRAPQAFDPTRPMKRHGENWASVLRELVKEDGKGELLVGLKKLTGDIEDVKVTSAAGFLIPEFKQRSTMDKGKRWFGAQQQSDGTLRVAGLLTALLQSPALGVVGVEEPELTVHPGALPMLYDYLKQASEVSQVLVTTHSPVLLDVVDIDQDAVFVVERRDGVTAVQRMGEREKRPVQARLLRLGELLLSGDLQLSPFGEEPERP